MPLQPGDKLGPYKILAPIGAGGMGEVYKARDTKLDREVAIKVLPAVLAQDPERLARFEREAKVLALLNHPNIAQIYGLEESDGIRALVMELVPGNTLKGPIPLETALNYGKQVAEALEAAHEKGIVHRDLKPANIIVTPVGVVKVLDFGLAAVPEPSAASGDPNNSPTLTMGATQAGMILGTAGYMAPEQAAGQPVDRRADIWAFGVVLYEMLTGQRLFTGDSVAHILADVLRAPIDFDKLPKEAPRATRNLVKRCLDRDVKTRLRDIGEARIAIQNVEKEPEPVAGAVPTSRLRWLWLGAAAFAIMIALAVSFSHFHGTPPSAPVLRTNILPPDNTTFNFNADTFGPVALSPDGQRIVLGVTGADGKNRLWTRSLDNLVAQPLDGTEGATFPFWSPNGKFIGFFASGKLKRTSVSGGPPTVLCDAPNGRGGTWNATDVIVFTPRFPGPLYRVAASGGDSYAVTSLDQVRREKSHKWPWFLPDGRHFLYSTDTGIEAGKGVIRVGSLDSAETNKVIEVDSDTNAAYAEGYLLFLRDDILMAQPLDLRRLVTSGDAIAVAEHIQLNPITFRAVFSVSENGLLTYRTGSEQDAGQLAWLDRTGKQITTVGDRALFGAIHLSSRKEKLAVGLVDPVTHNRDIWLYDVLRGLRTRFTFDRAPELEAVWSPDGNTIVFSSRRKGQDDLFAKPANGLGSETLVYADSLNKTPQSWSPDGKFLLYRASDPKTKLDLWVLPMVGERKPYLFAQSPFNELNGQFSPNGRWIAYQSDESQRTEIYVAPFPGPGGKQQISTSGGALPRWRRDGKELFYIAPDRRLVAAEVKVNGDVLEVGSINPLFGPLAVGAGYQYDVSVDGQRFLAAVMPDKTATEPLMLVQNWTAGLKK